jgi:hypothetical protein
MTTNKARLGAGNVEIVLDGETAVLKPTLRAAQTLSRQHGGIAAAIEAVGKMDFDALASVIALGLNRTDTKEVAEQVWTTGMTELAAPAIRYLSMLANGGRAPDQSGGDEQEENPQ